MKASATRAEVLYLAGEAAKTEDQGNENLKPHVFPYDSPLKAVSMT
jgi:hypothetical protein